MKFSNLSRRIGDFAARGSITQEDALSLMSVLCDDIRFDSGIPVDRCAVRDWEQLIDELYALSYTINTLYQAHKKTIMAAEQTDSEDELWQQLREAEAACEAARGQAKQRDALQEKLQQRQKELEELTAAAQNKEAQMALYRSRVAQLEQELDALRHTELQPLTERFAALEQEQAQKQELLQQLRQEVEQKEGDVEQLRLALQTHEAAAADLEQQRSQLRQRLDAVRSGAEAGTADVENLRQQLQQAQQTNAEMSTECGQVREQLNILLADNEALREIELIPAQQQLTQAQTESAQLQQDLQLCREAAAALEQQRSQLRQQLEETKTQAENSTRDVENLRQQLREAEQLGSDMTTEFVQVRCQLEAQQADNAAFREGNLVLAQQQLNEAKAEAQQMHQTLVSFTAERETIGAQISQTGILIATKQVDLDNKKKQLADRNAELEHLNGQLSAITADMKPLLEEIEMRKQHLEGMDREQIEADLRQSRDTWNSQIQELEQKQRQCAELREEISRKTSLVTSERERLESLTAQKREQEEAYKVLCRDVETLNTRLEELQDPEYLRRIEKLQNQFSVLQQLRSNLEKGNRDIGCGWSFNLQPDLDQRLNAVGKSLKDLQKTIQDYATLWQNNLNQ